MIEIEKGIEIPRARGRERIYPWMDMEVGDSFLVGLGEVKNMRSQCNVAGKKYGRTYATRKVDGGIRVWRIE